MYISKACIASQITSNGIINLSRVLPRHKAEGNAARLVKVQTVWLVTSHPTTYCLRTRAQSCHLRRDTLALLSFALPKYSQAKSLARLSYTLPGFLTTSLYRIPTLCCVFTIRLVCPSEDNRATILEWNLAAPRSRLVPWAPSRIVRWHFHHRLPGQARLGRARLLCWRERRIWQTLHAELRTAAAL